MKQTLFSLMTCCIFFVTDNVFSQDLTAFEIMDNESVGLTVAPFAKGGLAIHDIDRNGYQDIFCLRWNEPGYSRIYVNDGGFFQDITEQSPLEQIESVEDGTRTTVWADFDNDGDRDLALATTKGIHLLRNDNNAFTDVSEEMGFVAPKPANPFITTWDCNIGGWADYDLDGDLDCSVSQLGYDNLYLFRNDGDHFTDVATEAGLDTCVIAKDWRHVFTDIDLDGDADLVGREHFFLNENGHFADATEQLGFAGIDNVWYKRFFDYDNDGDLDFFKATRAVSGEGFDELWENRDGVFYDISSDVGLVSIQYKHRGMTVGDFDNDGDQDIFLDGGSAEGYDVLFVNDEIAPNERVFADVAEFVGITKIGDRKNCGFLDYDRDGFLDIYMPSAEYNHLLYHNLAINSANWVGFILEGTVSNRDAVGSIVTLYTGEKKQVRLTRCGDQHFNQYNPWVHFGIGLETSIDSVVIRWPLGLRQVLTDVAINQYHEIQEPGGTGVELNMSQIPKSITLYQNFPNPFNPTTTVMYSLSTDADVRLGIYDITGKEVAVLVNARQSAGGHSVTWDGRDDHGHLLPSGVYMYRLQAGDFVESKKMVFVR